MIAMGAKAWKSLIFLIQREIANKKANLRPINRIHKKKEFLKRLMRESENWDVLIESFLKADIMADVNFDNYLAWIIRKNLLQKRITEFEKCGNGPRGMQYIKMLAFMYRAAGDLNKAQKAAEKARHTQLALRISMEMGDFKHALQLYTHSSRRKDKKDIETLGWLATLLLQTGHKKEFYKIIDELEELVSQDHDKYWYVAKIFMINELFSEVIDLSMKYRSEQGRNILTFKGRPREYLEANQKIVSEKGAISLSYIRFLFQYEETEKARALFKKVRDKVLKNPSFKNLLEVLSFANSVKSDSFDALLKVVMKSKDIDFVKLAGKIFESIEPWWTYLKLTNPDDNDSRIFQKCCDLFHQTLSKDKILHLIAEIDEVCNQLPVKQQLILRKSILRQYKYRRQTSAVIAEYRKMIELSNDPNIMLEFGNYYLQHKEWIKAAELYKKASLVLPDNSLPLYLWGYTLFKSGSKEDGKKKMSLASLLILGNSKKRYALADALETCGLFDAADSEFKLLMFTEYYYSSWYLQGAYQALARQARRSEKNLLQAGNYINIALFACLCTNISFLSHEAFMLSSYRKHLFCAEGFMNAKQFTKALKEYQSAFSLFHDAVDESIKAIELFEKNNRKKDAETLYRAHKALLVADLDALPKSSHLRNSLAWFMACSDHDLEEALVLSQDVVKKHPKNDAYIDTLAEVYFRLKNREKAVEWQKKAVKHATDRKFMEKRLHHFEKDPFEK